MSDDKSREQFEAHARRDHDFEDGDFRMLSNGKYYWGTTQMLWGTWQAAYSAISSPENP